MLSGRLCITTIVTAVVVGAALWLSFGVLAVTGDGTRVGVLPRFRLLAFSVLMIPLAG